MSSAERAFHATVNAQGFVIDVPLVGEAEARRRVMAVWADGTVMRHAPDGTWIVILPSPISIRADRSPGMALTAHGSGYVGVGVDRAAAKADVVVLPAGGNFTHLPLSELPLVDRSTWVTIGDVGRHRLVPLDAPPPPVSRVETAPSTTPANAPDLRAAAGVGSRSGRAARALRGLVDEAPRGGWRWRRGTSPQGTLVRNQTAGKGLLAKLIMRSPASRELGRRHNRYIRELTEEFNSRRWDDALRNAIALGGTGGKLRLRLPRRRLGALRPSSHGGLSGRSIPYGQDIQQHLRTLYRTAAEQLEREGRIIEAAYVLTDLLASVGDAVALLERHREYRIAAELAEGRKLPADVVVRLWWRQGDRQRALDIARIRGAFGGAVHRLVELGDVDAARSLRVAWIETCRAAGDHMGAVTAAWPDEALRPTVVEDIRIGLRLGGPLAARLLAYLVTLQPWDAARHDAAKLLSGSDDGGYRARADFVATIAELHATDATYDRELASASLRMLYRDADVRDVLDDAKARRVHTALKFRADPLLAADAPPLPRRVRQPTDPLDVVADEAPGDLPVLDAVTLQGRTLLVAAGERGARLVTLDGRTITHWDVPTHQLIVADHGATALLVTHHDTMVEIHLLDLATRKVSHWASLATRRLVPSFDGGLLIVADDRGLSVIDTSGPTPRVVWRALEPGTTVLDYARSETKLSAVVTVGGRAEAWSWTLPGTVLRNRGQAPIESFVAVRVTDDGRVIALRQSDGAPRFDVVVYHQSRVIETRVIDADADHPPRLLASASLMGVVHAQPDESLVLDLATERLSSPDARITFPGGPDHAIGMRSHARLVTAWKADGRCVTVDLAARSVIASMRTRN